MISKDLLLVALLIISLTSYSSASAVPMDPWAKLDAIVTTIVAPRIPEHNVDIRDFGAVPGPNNNALPAINKAIKQAVQKGGGRIIIPSGLWHVKGPIHLQSKINLHLQEGATILFIGSPSDYLPTVKQRWEGTEVFNYSPMIYARDVSDVAITGKGVIDGNIDSPFHAWHKKQGPDIKKLRIFLTSTMRLILSSRVSK